MSDEELLCRFEDRSLPFAEWTHRAHVKVAYLYLRRHDYATALAKMREGIQAYNAAHQVPESVTRGYNETTTCAMMQLVAATIAAYGATHPTATADDFCNTHSQLMNKSVLRLFYSPRRRMDPDAKTRFVEPDLAPLPQIRTNDDGHDLH